MVYCSADLQNQNTQDKLLADIKALGGYPRRDSNRISIRYTGSNEDAIVELFEGLPEREVTIIR